MLQGIEGESLLLLLDAKGISASSGFRVHVGLARPSHVLLAIGWPHEVAHGSLRLTLCEEEQVEEVEYMLKEIPAGGYGSSQHVGLCGKSLQSAAK